MTPEVLAERLRWLAGEWREATPLMRLRIESAFRRGRELGRRARL